MFFDVAGPFKIKRHGKKRLITQASKLDLRNKVEEWEPGLSNACGCYVFATRAGSGVKPWYVGQACSQSILDEALNSSNINTYNYVLDGKGTPLLFLIPARTKGGKFRKRPASRNLQSLNFLERWLIAEALGKNRKLVNTKETKFLRLLHVTGLFNPRPGESTKASQELRKTLGR